MNFILFSEIQISETQFSQECACCVVVLQLACSICLLFVILLANQNVEICHAALKILIMHGNSRWSILYICQFAIIIHESLMYGVY